MNPGDLIFVTAMSVWLAGKRDFITCPIILLKWDNEAGSVHSASVVKILTPFGIGWAWENQIERAASR